MIDIGKFLLFIAAILGILGLLLIFFEKIPYIGRLPGDIIIQRKNFTFYFPLATSIIISLIISILINLFKR